MNKTIPQTLSNYEIIKLHPTEIQMRHKQTRRIYRYIESSSISSMPINIPESIYLCQPLQVEIGLLYPCGYMTLGDCMGKNSEGSRDEEEVWNTIEPIIKALYEIHESNQTYGGISTTNVIINEEGSIKLYYPSIESSLSKYYPKLTPNENHQHHDFRALAVLTIELLFQNKLENQSEYTVSFENSMETFKTFLLAENTTTKYCKTFICCILSMILAKIETMKKLVRILISKNSDLSLDFDDTLEGEAQQIYSSFIGSFVEKKESTKRSEFTPPLIKCDYVLNKKTVNLSRKYPKIENTENKQPENNSKKKSDFNNIIKKITNAKVEAISPNYKKILYNVGDIKETDELCKMAANIKRMRTFSRRKVE